MTKTNLTEIVSPLKYCNISPFTHIFLTKSSNVAVCNSVFIHTKTQAFVIRNYLENQFSMTMKNHKVNCIVHFVEIKLLK